MLLSFLKENNIFINPKVSNKQELFQFAGNKAAKYNLIEDEKQFINGLTERENQASTELKPGIAIPHTRLESIKELFVMVFVFNKSKLKYSSGFSKGIQIVFLIGSPINDDNHLKVLGSIARLIGKNIFIDELLKANVPDDVILCIKKHSITKHSLVKGQKKFLVTLSLNKPLSNKILSAIFLELGIRQTVQYKGEILSMLATTGLNITSFLSGSNIGAPLTSNRLIMGICDDENNINKLYKMLLDEGIDINEPGAGSLYSIELNNFFGGTDIEIDF